MSFERKFVDEIAKRDDFLEIDDPVLKQMFLAKSARPAATRDQKK